MNAIPWYKSQVLIAAIVSVITGVVAILGKQNILPADVITATVQNVMDVIAVAAAAYAALRRATASAQPIKSTQAAADAHNATPK